MEKRILIAESRGFPAAARRQLERQREVILADLDRAGLEAAMAGAPEPQLTTGWIE